MITTVTTMSGAYNYSALPLVQITVLTIINGCAAHVFYLSVVTVLLFVQAPGWNMMI